MDQRDEKPVFKFIGSIGEPIPSTAEPALEEKPAQEAAKKPVVRRRPAGVKPKGWGEETPREFPVQRRPPTPHDRYLTYDGRGRLITHTVYHGPLPEKPVATVFPHAKKHKSGKQNGDENSNTAQ